MYVNASLGHPGCESRESPHYDCVVPMGLLYRCPESSIIRMCLETLHVRNRTDWIGITAEVIAIAFPTMVSAGFLSNLLVCIVLCHSKMRSATNSYLLCSVLAHLIYIVCTLILRLGEYSEPYGNSDMYLRTKVYILHLFYLSWMMHMWMLICASAVRVLDVQHPNISKSLCSPLRADVITVLICFIAFGCVVPLLWFREVIPLATSAPPSNVSLAELQRLGYEEERTSCTALFWIHASISLFVPYPAVILFLYLLRRAMRKANVVRSRAATSNTGEILRRKSDQENQQTVLVMGLSISILILTIPFGVGQILFHIRDRVLTYVEPCVWLSLLDIFQSCVLLYSTLQFFLYACLSSKFQHTLKSMLCKC